MNNKASVQASNDWEWTNQNTFMAYDGLCRLNYKVEKARDRFDLEKQIEDDSDYRICCGHVRFVQNALRLYDIDVPDPIDYPEGMVDCLGRDINKVSVEEIDFPAFVKPVRHKAFTGDIFESREEFEGVFRDEVIVDKVWVSEIVDFRSEYRIMVMRSDDLFIEMKHYAGDSLVRPDRDKVEHIIDRALDSDLPVAFSIDIGVTSSNDVLLIEVNDSYALGNYGVSSTKYAQMLEARWEEITQRE